MLEFIRKHRKKIFVALILGITILLSLPLFVLKKTPEVGGLSKIEIIAFMSQILAAMFAIVGTYIAVSQYYISSQSEVINIEESRVDRALKLAEFYKDNILKDYSVIRKIYKEVGIFDILHKNKNQMERFDSLEMEEIFTPKDLKNIKRIKVSPEYQIMLMGLELVEKGADIADLVSQKDNRMSINKRELRNALMLTDKRIANLMNNMELFSMYFSHNIADESVVYQSLYPSYIEICRTLYFDIASCSQTGMPYLYRNVQTLYSMWVNKSNTKNENMRKHQSDLGKVLTNLKK